MKTAKRRRRLGTLFFFIPIVLIVAVIAYAVVTGTASPVGTLIVTAQSSARYSASVTLEPQVTVGTQRETAPHTFSLDQGTYTVVYSSLTWYTTPPQRVINVTAGKTSYAVGVYDPTVETVSISGNRFSASQVGAMHGVTPVVWVNKMTEPTIIFVGSNAGVEVQPSQNLTYVFRSTGSFVISLSSSNSTSMSVFVV